MTTDNNASGETQQVSDDVETKDGKVAYETFKKLLGEKKRIGEEYSSLKKRLEEFEGEKKSHEENKLREQNEFKKLVDLRDRELSTTRKELEALRVRELNAKKLDSFLKVLGAPIKREYWQLIDFDSVIANDKGDVDEMSVTQEVDRFKKQYPEILSIRQSSNYSSMSPNGNGVGISYEEWLKLPLKEMKAKYNQIRPKKE